MQSESNEPRILKLLAIVPRLAIWSVVCGIVTSTMADPDLWGHVRFGLDMVRDRAVARVDPYSFTSDRPWVNHEWLAEVSMALAYSWLGGAGLVLLKSGLLLGAFAIVLREAARQGAGPLAQAAVLAMIVIGSTSALFAMRPQSFSILAFTLVIVGLRRADDGRARWLVAIPVVFALWANLHGGWLVGLGVVGLWTACRIAWPQRCSRLAWVATGLTSVLATLATPYGIELWRFLWHTVGFDRADIIEWQSLWALPLEMSIPWLVTLALGAVALVRTRPELTHVMVALLLAVVSFRVVRVSPFFSIAVAVLLAPPVLRNAKLRLGPGGIPIRGYEVAALAVAAVLVVAGGLFVSARQGRCIDATRSWTPDPVIMRWMHENAISGRLLTWFDWGESAIWHLAPRVSLSFDGRRETVYSQAIINRHRAVYLGREGWENALAEIDPDLIWLPVQAPILDRLESQGWHRIVQTPESSFFARRPYSELPKTLEPIARPACFPG